MANPPRLRDVIARHGLSAKKSLGQNYLLDGNLLAKIVRVAGQIQDATVYEVGPGPGGLTRAILAAGVKCLVAVEVDHRAIAALQELAATEPRLTCIAADALQVDEQALIGITPEAMPIHVIANLPYNVGTALLVRWLTVEAWPPWWQSLTLMFQKEVAERIVAAPGSAAYGRLAVLAQWRSHARIAMTLPRSAFVPPPNVESAVVHLTPAAPLYGGSVGALERVTQAAFGQRRKMLRSSLRTLGVDVNKLLDDAKIAGDRRAETLSIREFCQLAAAL